MNGDEAFLSRLADHPDDDTTRLVYADWLEERGDPRAAHLRAEVALAALDPEEEGHTEVEECLAAARQGLDLAWLAAAGRAYDLVLTGYDPPCKIAVIKSIRELSLCGLHEAKVLSESLPAKVLTEVSRLHAEHGRERLKASGSGELTAVIRPSQRGELVRLLRGAELSPAIAPAPGGPYSMLLLSYDPDRKLHVIRTLRELTGLGLAESQARVEQGPPVFLLHNVCIEQFSQAQDLFGPGVRLHIVEIVP